MTLGVSRFLVQKEGYEVFECEDSISVHLGRRRFAIADGATEGYRSRFWARYLTAVWVKSNIDPHEVGAIVTCLQSAGQRLNIASKDRELPWFLETKARRGSFATFLGLAIDDEGRCKAVAVGDCCLMLEDADGFQDAFPISDPTKFGNTPHLVSSEMRDSQIFSETVEQWSTQRRPGLRLSLMSDALAKWFLQYAISDRQLHLDFQFAVETSCQETFEHFIANERQNQRLRNDDVALLQLRF